MARRLHWILLGAVCVSLAFASDIASAPNQRKAKNMSIDANSFEVDAKQNTLIASGNVVVLQGDIRITGDGGIYFQSSQRIVLSGNVRVEREKMTLTCERAIASGTEDRIEVSGNVRYVYKDIQGSSGTGIYDRKAQTVLLSGSPKVWQNRDVLSGESILVDIQKSKVTTYGRAKAVFSVEKFSGN